MRGSTRIVGGAVTALVGLTIAVPLTWTPSRDSFPVSSYPMFSARKDDAGVDLVVAAIRADPASTDLEVLPTEATGHRHLTQAVRALYQAVADGGERPARLCAEVAAWARADDRIDGEVIIATVHYDALEYLLHGDRDPEVRRVHAECEVGG